MVCQNTRFMVTLVLRNPQVSIGSVPINSRIDEPIKIPPALMFGQYFVLAASSVVLALHRAEQITKVKHCRVTLLR
jgi:hypothetical protein